MSTPLRVETDGPVQVWTINVPEVGNAITGPEVIAGFETLVDAVNQDNAIRAVILTGAGKIFSAGGNVKEMADRQGMFGLAPIDQRPRVRGRHPTHPPRARSTRGAVDRRGQWGGHRRGLRSGDDVRYSHRLAARVVRRELRHARLIPGDGGTWFLPRAIGYARAAELTFTGERIDADTALEWGLVSRVAAHDELLSEARALADRIAVNPPHALRMAKRLLQESVSGSLESTLAMAAAMQPLAHHDTEHEQRIARWRTS